MKVFIFAIAVLATIALAKGRKCSFSERQWEICKAAKAELNGIAGIKEDFMPADLVAKLNASIFSAMAADKYSPRMKKYFMRLDETLYHFNESAVETNNIIMRRLKQTTEKLAGAKDCLDELTKLEKDKKLFQVACKVADDYQAIATAFKQAVIQEYQRYRMSLDDLGFVNRMARALSHDLENELETSEDFVHQLESELKNLMRDFKNYRSVTRNMDEKAAKANQKFIQLAEEIIASLE